MNYYQQNKEKIKKERLSYYYKNKERYQQYNIDNKSKRSTYFKSYYEKNKEKIIKRITLARQINSQKKKQLTDTQKKENRKQLLKRSYLNRKDSKKTNVINKIDKLEHIFNDDGLIVLPFD